MTKAELIKKLSPYPDNMEVFLDGGKTDFRYGLLNSVIKKEISYMEEPEGKVLAKEAVIILDEE